LGGWRTRHFWSLLRKKCYPCGRVWSLYLPTRSEGGHSLYFLVLALGGGSNFINSLSGFHNWLTRKGSSSPLHVQLVHPLRQLVNSGSHVIHSLRDKGTIKVQILSIKCRVTLRNQFSGLVVQVRPRRVSVFPLIRKGPILRREPWIWIQDSWLLSRLWLIEHGLRLLINNLRVRSQWSLTVIGRRLLLITCVRLILKLLETSLLDKCLLIGRLGLHRWLAV